MAEQWTVKGRIVVDHLLPELEEMLGPRSGLGGIKVKVSARSRVLSAWGTWNSWGTVTTGRDGSFRVTEEKGSDRRQFKVQILFDSGKLRIKEGGETSIGFDTDGFPIDVNIDLTDKDWHEVHNDKNRDTERRAGVHDLGDIDVRGIVRKHGDIWVLYNKVIDLMESYGNEYVFDGKVVVKYPMSLTADGWASYWNPINRRGYIKESHFNAYTLLHEISHQWEYDHCTGEDAIVWQLFKHGDTHQPRENTTFVPFLESFADWAAVNMLREMSGGKLKNFVQAAPYTRPEHPFTREYIGGNLSESERNLANLDYTERGWYGLFNVLTYQYLDRIDVDRPFTDTQGTDTRYAFLSLFSDVSDLRTGYSFKDVLSVFLPKPSREVNAVLKTREMNFADFLNRAKKIIPGLDDAKVKGVKAMLNPKPARAAAAVG